jgi:hypothetical protein
MGNLELCQGDPGEQEGARKNEGKREQGLI